jgi:prepilin-type processing-associated H-X9-DG protein
MKMMAYGDLRFDRASIPAELRDVANWPGADDGALSRDARNVLPGRIQAMALFVDGHTSLREIGRVTGLRFNDLYRLFDRCVTMHEDGRIFGMR